MSQNDKRPPILLLSPPAAGKTSSLRYLTPELAARTLLINCDAKALPWIGGGSKIQLYTAACPTHIPGIIKAASASGKYDLIVVDTITIAMGEYSRRFLSTDTPKYVLNAEDQIVSDMNYIALTDTGVVNSQGGWGRYATLVTDIVAECTASPAQTVVMGHLGLRESEVGELTWKCPIQGQVGKTGLESLFSIVMHASSKTLTELQGDLAQDHQWLGKEETIEFTGERFVFQVAHTARTVSTHALRTIDGLWPRGVRFIDSNMQLVFDRIAEVHAD